MPRRFIPLLMTPIRRAPMKVPQMLRARWQVDRPIAVVQILHVQEVMVEQVSHGETELARGKIGVGGDHGPRRAGHGA